MNDLSAFATSMRAFPAALTGQIEAAETKTANEARTVAILQFSSGQNSQADLNKAGNPYARRAPQSAYNPAVINGTRAFLYDWQPPAQTTETGSDSAAGTVTYTFVENTDPNTIYLWGTDLMVDRSGMLVQIATLVQPTRLTRLSQCAGLAFRQAFN